ncbi:MAG: hypothetical protein H5T64_08680 [Chloroflexi bacterium]|nr:hypothetical protein [Chloroflexota bacterium]
MSRKSMPVHMAVIAVWAAVLAAASLLPSFPILGTGGSFSIASALVSLSGVFFGPLAGGLCAAIGSIIGGLLAPNTFWAGPPTFLVPTAGAIAAGFAMRRQWLVPLVAIIVLGLAWYLFPLGRQAWFMPTVYLLGVVAIGLLATVFKGWLSSTNPTRLFVAVFLTTLTGIVVSQTVGNLLALNLFKLPRALWATLVFIAPVERLTFALGAAVVGTPLLIGLPKVGVPVGPALYEPEEG